jgi:NAD(P)-dependent dehydrogenase (short-subunit alcohol dehydrogenase family)
MSIGAPLAVLTGASRGIGLATVRLLSRRGLRLALLGRRSPELDQVRSECLERGAPEARIFEGDLEMLDTVVRAGETVLLEAGVPDVVVHNAGVARRVPIEDLSLDLWREQIDVNLGAPYALTRALLPAMRARGTGRLIFVGSISGTLGTARQSAYCASKWGLTGFMKSLSEELRDTGLMACSVLPGSVDTAMLEGSGFEPRMTPDDVARTLVHYALDAPLAHNGAVIEMFGV